MFAIALLVSFLLSLQLSTASPRDDFQWIQVKGTSIVREDGTTIVLRGTNLPSLRYFYHAASAYERFLDSAKSMGFNVVRLPILWSELQPSFGIISSSYLGLIQRIVNYAERIEIYVVLDMHQYGMAEKFGGQGFPIWAVSRFRSLDEAVVGFWSDISFQGELEGAWTTLASVFVNDKAILGYDLLNEPSPGPIPWDRFAITVNDFHTRLISRIQGIDPRHIIFFEPTDICACTSIFGNQKILRPQGTNLVFSPHVYVRGSDEYLEYYAAGLYNLTIRKWNIPLWVGEFGGVDVQVENQDSLIRLNATLNLLGHYGLGWAYWQLSETKGGPQLIDAYGRTSPLLTDMIVRGVSLLSRLNLSNGDYLPTKSGYSQIRTSSDTAQNLQALAALTIILVLPAIIIPLTLLSIRRYIPKSAQCRRSTSNLRALCYR